MWADNAGEPVSADLAWELAKQHRSCLTIAELNSMFIKLGVGECAEVIELVEAAGASARQYSTAPASPPGH